MGIIPLLLFSVSCNFDNFIIGVSYGIKNISVPLKANIMIALPTLLGTYISLNAGRAFFSLLPAHFANVYSFLVLLFIGTQMIIGAVKKHKSSKVGSLADSNIEKYDIDNNGEIDTKEAFMLGLFLAMNNIGLGIGFSTSSYNIILTTFSTCLLSAVGFNIGNHFGKKCFSKLLSSYTEIVSGVLIIVLGIIELFF